LGRNNPGYSGKAVASGFEATNAGQEMVTGFTSEGVEVRHGNARWGLALRGYGYGDALTTVKAVMPQSHKNRVEYRHDTLTEWYVNGPVGLEQGFTLSQPPDKADGQPLTIALAVSGNLTMQVEESGTSVSLREREGKAALRYTGLTATDAEGTELKAWLQVQSERLLLRVKDVGARYPILIDPWVQLAKLTASDGIAIDTFGYAVAISGNTVVVGAPKIYHQGYQCTFDRMAPAYVFVKQEGGWGTITETAQLAISDPDGFYSCLGTSVAINANTIVVGMYNGNGFSTWGAYVFVEPKGGWKNMTETAKLTATDAAGGFGLSVAISRDTVVAGSPLTGGQHYGAGAAYVFVKPASGWVTMTETAKLTPSDPQSWAYFGSCVSVNNGTVVVTKHGDWNCTLSVAGGAAYVFVKPPTGWRNMTEIAKLTTSNGDGFGAVSVRADTVVAGAPSATVGSNAAQGAVYVFVKPTTGWASMTETAKLTSRDGAANHYFGASVFFGGYRIVVGAPGADIGPNVDQGAVYVFAKPATGWKTTNKFNAKLTAADGAAGDGFGSAVSISNGVVVAGAPNATIGSNAQQGAAYVFGRQQ
jgi:hypothetical protein